MPRLSKNSYLFCAIAKDGPEVTDINTFLPNLDYFNKGRQHFFFSFRFFSFGKDTNLTVKMESRSQKALYMCSFVLFHRRLVPVFPLIASSPHYRTLYDGISRWPPDTMHCLVSSSRQTKAFCLTGAAGRTIIYKTFLLSRKCLFAIQTQTAPSSTLQK